MSNSDETHFVVKMDNGKTLGFSGDHEIRYADVTSGGEGITMLVRLTGGPGSKIAIPFLIFTNKERNYPIRGVLDNIPVVCYRTGPNGWMYSINMVHWLRERPTIKPLTNGRIITLFIDNCSSHNLNEELLDISEQIRTTILYFPANTTDLNQPCDYFVIQKLKDAWRNRWDE